MSSIYKRNERYAFAHLMCVCCVESFWQMGKWRRPSYSSASTSFEREREITLLFFFKKEKETELNYLSIFGSARSVSIYFCWYEMLFFFSLSGRTHFPFKKEIKKLFLFFGWVFVGFIFLAARFLWVDFFFVGNNSTFFARQCAEIQRSANETSWFVNTRNRSSE